MRTDRQPRDRVRWRLLLVLVFWAAATAAQAQQPSPAMSFFVTSTGNGAAAGDLGGLPGADARCARLAAAAGAGDRSWRAYLSTAAVDARDRIGVGPWYDYDGEQVAADLQALHSFGIAPSRMLTEIGSTVPTSEQSILTGSTVEGRLSTGGSCSNWTSNDPLAIGIVGSTQWVAGLTTWNFALGAACDETGLNAVASSGRLYCFAATEKEVPTLGEGARVLAFVLLAGLGWAGVVRAGALRRRDGG